MKNKAEKKLQDKQEQAKTKAARHNPKLSGPNRPST